jgi:hypothetical protein
MEWQLDIPLEVLVASTIAIIRLPNGKATGPDGISKTRTSFLILIAPGIKGTLRGPEAGSSLQSPSIYVQSDYSGLGKERKEDHSLLTSYRPIILAKLAEKIMADRITQRRRIIYCPRIKWEL